MRRLRAPLALAAALSLVAVPGIADAASVIDTYAVGQKPFAVVSDPFDGRLYVANSGTATPSGTGTISVVDPATASVGSLSTSKPSGLLALDSAARRLYSSNYDPLTDSVSFDVLDLGSGSLLATLPVGGLGVALDPTVSRAFVVGAGKLFAVDTATFAAGAPLSAPPGQFWLGVAVDSALHQLYVTNGDSSNPSLVVLDTRDLSLIDEIPLGRVPRFAIAVDAATHRVFVAGSDPLSQPFMNARLYAIDGTTRQITDSEGLGGFPGGIAFDEASQSLWVTDMNRNDVIGLDARTLNITTPGVPLMWQPALAAFGTDGLLYIAAHSTASLVAVDAVPRNTAPVITSGTVSPPEAKTNDVITAFVVAHDPEGDPVTLSYQWSVNKVAIAGETGQSLDLSKPGNGDKHDFICLTVTASDGQLESTGFNCFLQVQDSAPVVSVTLDTTAPTTNAGLTATASATDADGDAITYTFTWKVDGALRRTATSPNASASFDLALPGNGDKGQTVTVEVVASDDLIQGAAASASAVVANSSPTAAVALNDHTPQSRDVLVATVETHDPDGDALTLTYTWQVRGITKQTGASNSFDLALKGNGDNGDVVTVIVTASDGVANASESDSATVTQNPRH